jgi:hypothetical protein
MKHLLIPAALFLTTAIPASAEDYTPIVEKETFLTLIEGRDLRLPLYGLTLKLSPDGQIEGRALGWGVTGTWRWEDGYFCRQMDWSGMEIPDNCQLVEARGDTNVRFTVDRGAGEAASFRLQ